MAGPASAHPDLQALLLTHFPLSLLSAALRMRLIVYNACVDRKYPNPSRVSGCACSISMMLRAILVLAGLRGPGGWSPRGAVLVYGGDSFLKTILVPGI